MPRPPNVVFVITDDQGYGDIGCHGNPHLKTPHLDRLASESAQLDDHHHDPLCSPSRAALLTGQYAARNGVWHVIHGRHLLDPSAVCMAELFAENGYRTGMFGKWHLGDNYPFAPQYRGFDEVLCHRGGGLGELPDYWGNSYLDDVYFRDGAPLQCAGYCTDVFFDAALDFVNRHAKQPFFVYLATNAMHAPFIVPERYAAPYNDMDMPADRANFYGMIANFDENMGRLLDRLKALGLDENTIVLFAADHGTAAGWDEATGSGFNAGMRGVKGSVYEGGHRVNFFLRWKGKVPAGHKLPGLTAHIDVLPTLLDLCDIESDCPFDGISLAQQLLGTERDLPQRSLVVQLQPDTPQKWHHCAVLNGTWRLINGSELYKLDSDPSQQHDVAAANPQVLAALRNDYESWWQDLQDAFASTVAMPVGTGHENPVLLSARDWHPTAGRVPWLQAWINDPAADSNGWWLIDIAQRDPYRIELRTHPREANLVMNASTARLQVGETTSERAVSAGDTAATFTLELPTGEFKLQTWLDDAAGDRERGAYYVYVEKLGK
ncbi:MAG: arylsulfatase [Chloroflexi bacterium]|nr:arylsulfatase [Chloroflexota bacterium]